MTCLIIHTNIVPAFKTGASSLKNRYQTVQWKGISHVYIPPPLLKTGKWIKNTKKRNWNFKIIKPKKITPVYLKIELNKVKQNDKNRKKQ